MNWQILRRIAAAVVTAALTVLVAAPGVSGAVPGSSRLRGAAITVTLTVPRYVAIAKQQTFLAPGITCPGGCTWDFGWRATWTAIAAGKPQETVIFSPYDMVPMPVLVQGGYVYDTDQLGVWAWTPVSDAYAIVPPDQMNAPVTDVRLGSRTSLAAIRSGLKVTLTVGAARYWQSKHNWAAYTSARGLVEFRNVGTTTWRSLREIHPNSGGWETWSYYTSVKREYRAYLYTTTYIWGSQSPNRIA